jgi:hypothetical protein
MPFGVMSFEIAQIMPVAIKGKPSRINEFADETGNIWALKERPSWGISRPLPTVH